MMIPAAAIPAAVIPVPIRAAIGFFFCCILLVFAVDPYVCYHRSFVLRQVYQKSIAMIPGLLRHEDFDSMMIGSSMAQNFDVGEINSIFRVNCIKTTTAGLPSETLSVYLDKAIAARGKKLKKIFVCFDFWMFSKDGVRLHDRYKYLYRDSFFAPEYFFSADTFESVFNAVLTNIVYPWDATAKQEADRNKMFANKPRIRYGKKILFRSIARDSGSVPQAGINIQRNIRRDLIAHICKNPEIRFEIILPPYSIYYWALLKHHNLLEQNLELRNALAAELATFSNVRLHDLQAEKSVICEPDNYRDSTHYSRKISSWILEAVHSGQYTGTGIKENNARLCRIAGEYETELSNLLKQGKD